MEGVKRIWTGSWENDTILKEHITKYVTQRLQQKKILDFLQKDFPINAWR